MKKIILMLAVVGLVMQVNAQNLTEKDIPEAVYSSFTNAHPAVDMDDVNWTRQGLYYEGSFQKNDEEKSVTYDASGKLVKSSSEIASSALPPTALDYVKQHYNQEEVKKAFRVTDAKNTVSYEAEVKGEELHFDSNGNIVSASDKD